MKNENLKNLKTRYRLPETTTPEDLACYWSTTLNFGNHVLLAGYYYAGPGKPNYFGAIYTFTTDDRTCEGVDYPGWDAFTVQFHPEACAGPRDTAFLFDRFIKLMEENGHAAE